VAVGDFNGDRVPDLAVANRSGVAVLVGDGDGTFQAPVNYPAGTLPRSVVVADFNGDTLLDLAVSNDDNKISVLLGNGDGSFQAPQGLGAGIEPGLAAVGDFNRDGMPDLAVSNATPSKVSVLMNNTR
jgi:hypothetical protein